ncbi:MAG: hypothetical protein ACI90V_007800, partial [Bacillariaceae sp.]|jgi:hypothetical protein
VDFFVPNTAGNTPLTHAVAYGRVDVVQWLRERAMALEEDGDDLIAKQLVSIVVNICVCVCVCVCVSTSISISGVDEESLIMIYDLIFYSYTLIS